MSRRQLYLAAYDVRDPKRLSRALAVVRDYATGGQKSVHECFLNAGEQRELLERISSVLDATVDRFVLLRLDPRCKTQTLGIGRAPRDPAFFYVR